MATEDSLRAPSPRWFQLSQVSSGRSKPLPGGQNTLAGMSAVLQIAALSQAILLWTLLAATITWSFSSYSMRTTAFKCLSQCPCFIELLCLEKWGRVGYHAQRGKIVQKNEHASKRDATDAARLDTAVKGGFYRMEGGREWEHEASRSAEAECEDWS